MKSIIDLSVKTKLVAVFVGFVILALVLTAVGFVGLSRAQAINSEVYETQTVPMETITKIVENILVSTACFDSAILATTTEEVAQLEQQMKGINTEIPSLISTYEPSIASDDERYEFENAVDIYTSIFVPKTDEIFSLLKQGKHDEADAAMVMVDAKTDEMLASLENCRTITTATNATYREVNNQAYDNLKLTMLITAAFIVVLLIGIGAWMPNSITRPMIAMKSMSEHVELTGNLILPDALQKDVDKAFSRGDEIGQSLRATVSMLKMFAERASSLNYIADGDLTGSVALKSDKDTIGSSLKTMLDSLNDFMHQISKSSEQVSIGSRQIAQSSQTLAQGSSEQSSAVEHLQIVIANMSEQILKNSTMSQEAASLGDKIRHDAQTGTKQMENMVNAVKEISEASQNINRVMKVIDDIAFQTNILALNAAVEAARAGQHGKGFAVVAEEVRNLASKSAEAAKETSTMIANSIEKAEIGSRIATETANSLNSIVGGINRSGEIISEIASSSAGQNAIIDEVGKGIEQITTTIHASAAVAEESSASSEEMASQADLLNQMLTQFKLKS